MTCIVALRDGDKCWLGGDSLGSNGHTGQSYKQHKVFKSNDCDSIIMGYTDSFRMGQVLQHSNGLFDELSVLKGEIDDRYMTTTFTYNLQALFESSGFETYVDGSRNGGTFLVCLNNDIYVIQNDYSVLEPRADFTAIGCGEDFATSSLYSTKDTELSPIERVYLALKCASQYSTGVGAPFVIINTESDEVITFDN